MLPHMQNYFADNSSCIVEIYDDTGVISTSNSNFCQYTWGNGMHTLINQLLCTTNTSVYYM